MMKCWLEEKYRGKEEGKTLVAVAVEVKGRKTGRVRLAKITDASSETLTKFILSLF